jgi:transcriptional regulator with XRE-family HTH domain
MKDGSVPLDGRGPYDPSRLIQELKQVLSAKNDSELARILDITHPLLSKIRNGKQPVTGAVLLRIHEVSGLSIRQLRDMLGDRRARFRLSSIRHVT